MKKGKSRNLEVVGRRREMLGQGCSTIGGRLRVSVPFGLGIAGEPRISCEDLLDSEIAIRCERLLGRPLAPVGFLEYALWGVLAEVQRLGVTAYFMTSCKTSLAWWPILGADAFHLRESQLSARLRVNQLVLTLSRLQTVQALKIVSYNQC